MTVSSPILFCDCSYEQVVSKDTKSCILNGMKERGILFYLVNDLCRAAKEQRDYLNNFSEQNNSVIIACYSRTVKWLFHRTGSNLKDGSYTLCNMRTQSAEEILSTVDSFRIKEGNVTKLKTENDGWISWFPVIDYDRCINCKQCQNFCLFGVYSLNNLEQVTVEKPANCKTNCPACARMCPQQAIIFPKYGQSPINGDEITETTVQSDLSNISSGDVYQMIRQRSTNQEHKLHDLADKLDIPQDVIASLKEPGHENLKPTTREQ